MKEDGRVIVQGLHFRQRPLVDQLAASNPQRASQAAETFDSLIELLAIGSRQHFERGLPKPPGRTGDHHSIITAD
jgi:hypothetical protein